MWMSRGSTWMPSTTPTLHLTPKEQHKEMSLWKWTLCFHTDCPGGPQKKADQKGRGKRPVKTWLTRQQATTNYSSGRRANVPVRKSSTVSTLGIHSMVRSSFYWIKAFGIKDDTLFPGNYCVCNETGSKTKSFLRMWMWTVSGRRGNRTLPSWSRHAGIPNQDAARWKSVGTSECNWITSRTP